MRHARFRLTLQFLPGLALLFGLTLTQVSATPPNSAKQPLDTVYCVTFLVQPDPESDVHIPRSINLNRGVVDGILASRHQNTVKKAPIRIGEEFYTPYSRLGKSSSEVFLARTSAGKVVVLKRHPLRAGHMLLIYEVMASRFYRAKGVDVPKIIDFDIQQGVLVKEYEPGLMMEELEEQGSNIFASPQSQLPEFSMSLTEFQSFLHDKHRDFNSWLHKYYPDYVRPLMEYKASLILKGDHSKPDNFVFSVEKGKWVLIDP